MEHAVLEVKWGRRGWRQILSHRPPLIARPVTCLSFSGADSSVAGMDNNWGAAAATANAWPGPPLLSPPPHRLATFVAASCTLRDPTPAQSDQTRNLPRRARDTWFFIDVRVAPRAPSTFVRHHDDPVAVRSAEPPGLQRNSPPERRRDLHHTSLTPFRRPILLPSRTRLRLDTRTPPYFFCQKAPLCSYRSD